MTIYSMSGFSDVIQIFEKIFFCICPGIQLCYNIASIVCRSSRHPKLKALRKEGMYDV